MVVPDHRREWTPHGDGRQHLTPETAVLPALLRRRQVGRGTRSSPRSWSKAAKEELLAAGGFQRQLAGDQERQARDAVRVAGLLAHVEVQGLHEDVRHVCEKVLLGVLQLGVVERGRDLRARTSTASDSSVENPPGPRRRRARRAWRRNSGRG